MHLSVRERKENRPLSMVVYGFFLELALPVYDAGSGTTGIYLRILDEAASTKCTGIAKKLITHPIPDLSLLLLYKSKTA